MYYIDWSFVVKCYRPIRFKYVRSLECLEMNACGCLVIRLAATSAADMESLIIDSIILHVVHVNDIVL